MTRDVRVLLAIDPAMDHTPVEALVRNEPELELVSIVNDERSWAGRHEVLAEAMVIACPTVSQETIELVTEARMERPTRAIVVITTDPPNGLVRPLFDAGADDIVRFEEVSNRPGDLAFAVHKALTRRATPTAEEELGGKLICVLGPKGGTGKTLTSTNLAVALAQEEDLRVAIVDLDLQFGDIGLVLGVTPDRSIYDLISAGGTLDSDKLDAFLGSHESGVRVLLAPTRPDHAGAVTPEFLHELFSVMKKTFDIIVVDTPPGFTPEVIAAIDAAAGIVLLGTLDAPSLKNAKLGAETLELMGYPSENVRIVLNRADSSVGVTHADVVTILGRAPDVLVPSTREIVRSVNLGEPIVASGPRSEAAKSFRALARLIASEHRPKEDRRSGDRRRRAAAQAAADNEKPRRGLLGLGR